MRRTAVVATSIAVGMAWTAAIVCSTILILHDHPFLGVLTLIVGLCVGASVRSEPSKKGPAGDHQ